MQRGLHKNSKIILSLAGIVATIACAIVVTHGRTFAVLDPHGSVAAQQKSLIIKVVLLVIVIVVPVFALIIGIAWRYRETNLNARYTPDWDGDKRLEAIWWGVPLLIIGVLSILILTSSHQLDPSRPIASSQPALQVRVVALRWKWLFIYPEQQVASVNLLKMPVNRPVEFTITSDAAMNSLWIPQLGGQVYAMSGMSTKLHLMADQTGTYHGSSANISGTGFADMQFNASAVSPNDFENWVRSVQHSDQKLTAASYDALSQPSTLDTPEFYKANDDALYDTIIMKYMSPDGAGSAHQSDSMRMGH